MSKNISYLRIRPCDNDNEIYLNSRKNEGTSAFFIKENTDVDIELIHSKEFQTISNNLEIDSDMWIVNEDNWKTYKNSDSKRLIYKYSGSREIALEIIDRLNPGFVLLKSVSDISFFKSIKTNNEFLISSYADSIEEALLLSNEQIDDLLLRDWSSEQILELQNHPDFSYYERTVLSPLFSIDEAREAFDSKRYFRYLNAKDVRGYRRIKTEWSPGSGLPLHKLYNFEHNNISQFHDEEFEEIIQKINNSEMINKVIYLSYSKHLVQN
jgi:hypothetical protein